MLKTHKNAFFEVVKNSGLDTSLFSAKEVAADTEETSAQYEPLISTRRQRSRLFRFLMFKSPSVESAIDERLIDSSQWKPKFLPFFIISLRNSQLYFMVTQRPDDFNLYSYTYSIFHPKYPKHHSKEECILEDTLKQFKKWLYTSVKPYLKEEQTPDLWSQIENYQSFVDEPVGTDKDTSEFTEEDKKEVRQSLVKFKSLIAENFNPSEEQQKYINEELNYLVEAVERLNRFDWRGLAISTLMAIAVNLSVDTEKGRVLFTLFKQAFQAGARLLQ